ncbi:MAG TPA: OmpH family outer membrane protein [Roseateles sp.]
MKKKAISAAIALQAVMACVWAEPLKIGFVDVQQALQESAPSKAAGARLESEFGDRGKELARQEARLREAGDKLQKESAALSNEERGGRSRELANQKRELERKRREFQEDAERRQQEEQRVVRDRFDKAVRQVFEDEKFDLILQDNVSFRSPAVDITRKVLDAMSAAK